VKSNKLKATVTIAVIGDNSRECSRACPYFHDGDDEDAGGGDICSLFPANRGEPWTRLRRTFYYGGATLRTRRCIKAAGR
jgi:hypothetical protein